MWVRSYKYNGKTSEAGWYDIDEYTKILFPLAQDLAGYKGLFSNAASVSCHNWTPTEKANVANTELGKFIGKNISDNTINILASSAYKYANDRNFAVSGYTAPSSFNVEDILLLTILIKDLAGVIVKSVGTKAVGTIADWGIFSKIKIKKLNIDADGWLMGKYVNGELKVIGNTNIAQEWDYIVKSNGEILVGRKHSWLPQLAQTCSVGKVYKGVCALVLNVVTDTLTHKALRHICASWSVDVVKGAGNYIKFLDDPAKASQFADEIIDINRATEGGGTLLSGSPSSAINTASYYSTVPEQGASIFKTIIKNHMFADGNKRTAVNMFKSFCNKSGITTTLTDAQLMDVANKVATNQLDDVLEISQQLIK